MPDSTITADQLRTVFLATELGNNSSDLTKFSYAEKGSSTYSFGLLQFDVGNSANAQQFLKDNGFSSDQVAQLSQQGGLTAAQLKPLNAQLQAIPSAKLDQFTDQQLSSTVSHVDNLISTVQAKNPAMADAIAKNNDVQLALADYDNQFSISGIGAKNAPANGMLSYLEGNAVKLPGGTIKLGDSISRSDIQQFINATQYGQSNPTPVKNREANLESALQKIDSQQNTLNGNATTPDKNTTPANSSPAAPHTAPQTAPATLRQGDHGQAVSQLQENLGQLGYKDAHGKPLQADGDFGPGTKYAVEAFQHDHKLSIDGKAGPETLKAIQQANPAHAQTPQGTSARLDDKNNPDHALYQQALNGVQKLDAAIGRTPDQHSENLAAALTAQAKAQGLTRIDTVAMNADGSHTFAAQNTTPLKNIADVATLQAMNTPIEKSSAAAQAVQPTPAPAQAQSQNQNQNQNQNQAINPPAQNTQQPSQQTRT